MTGEERTGEERTGEERGERREERGERREERGEERREEYFTIPTFKLRNIFRERFRRGFKIRPECF
jgi:hypothetical protein